MARPREFDEDQVLLASRECFLATGYTATTIDDLLTSTGLGKGSLYGAFGDKHQLFLRIFDDYCAGLVQSASEALRGPDAQAFARLRAYTHAVADATARDTARRGCLLAVGAAELAGRDPAVATQAGETMEALQDLLAACVAQAQRHGDIDADADPDQLAGLLLAVLRGIEALGKAGRPGTSLTSIARMAIAVLPRP